jgi:uncharacterized membrane protein HdeD (DUF308 family)
MSAPKLVDEMKKRAAWSIFMGVVTAALGAFLIVYPMATATFTIVLLGWALIFAGIAQFAFALHSQTAGKFFSKALLSLLYGLCGFWLAFFPIDGVTALTGLLGTLLLVGAGLGTVTAFQVRPLPGWGWFLFEAAVRFVMGALILVRWPSSSLWAIGTLVGTAVLTGGISRIMIASKIQSGAGKVDRAIQQVAPITDIASLKR